MTVGFLEREVSLNCTVCGKSTTVFWILDGEDTFVLTDSELMPRSNYLYITTKEVKNQLTFVATSVQNHTVSCLTTFLQGNNLTADESDSAYVLVQGNMLI